MNNLAPAWLCFQLGAREHYAIPRALASQGQLLGLVTDTWVEANSPLNLLPKSYLTSLRERFHPELNSAKIHSFNCSLLKFELTQRGKYNTEWELITARNNCFQNRALTVLETYAARYSDRITIFAYSYAALKLLNYAKKRGWKTVLGQIDPGIYEAELVNRVAERYRGLQSVEDKIPAQYWQDWHRECELADYIVVNSDWSGRALQKAGVEASKIKTIPLAFQPSSTKNFVRNYPDRFTAQNPLKVLFIGQIIIRKGIPAIFEAIELLSDYPLEFWFVGQIKINLPQTWKNHPQVKWLGAVSRHETNYYYRQADIFLLPTYSDGFAITQLEAQSWQLPLIVSQFCGAVVKEQNNGLILPKITGQYIAKSLIFCLQNPQRLADFSRSSTQIIEEFCMSRLSKELNKLF